MARLTQFIGCVLLLEFVHGGYFDHGGQRYQLPMFSPTQQRQIKKIYDKLAMPNRTDVILLFDTSNGISQWTFNEMKRLWRIALNCFDRQIRNTRLAMLAFGNSVHRIMDFDDCGDKDCVSRSLDKIRLTNTPGRALGQALKDSKRMFRKFGKRPNKIIVLITYGASNRGRGATVVARKLKKNTKAEIFVIAVGRNAMLSRGELLNIAGTSSMHDRYLNHFYLNDEQRFYGELSIAKEYISAYCSAARRFLPGLG